MVKRRILLVDQDEQALQPLADALRKADFAVSCSTDPHAALRTLPQVLPDALLVATMLPYLDGFELCRRVKLHVAFEQVPVVLHGRSFSAGDRAGAAEVGAADCWTQPLQPRETVSRLQALLTQPRAPGLLTVPADDLTGDLRELDVAALCNMMQGGRKSGTLVLQRATASGFVYFVDGRVIDAEVADMFGEAAVFQMLRWRDGTFCLNFGAPNRPVAMSVATHALLLEGCHRFDEWIRWLSALPPLESVMHLQPSAVQSVGIDAVSDPILSLVDGQRSILHILEASPRGDVETVEALSRYLRDGHVAAAPTIHAAPPHAASKPGAVAADPRSEGAARYATPLPPIRHPFLYDTGRPRPGGAGAATPRTPEEAFDLGPAPPIDQSYLDTPLRSGPRGRGGRLWFWPRHLTRR